MKAYCFITIENGEIVEMTDSTNRIELKPNQIPTTITQISILRAASGDIELAKMAIRDIERHISERLAG